MEHFTSVKTIRVWGWNSERIWNRIKEKTAREIERQTEWILKQKLLCNEEN